METIYTVRDARKLQKREEFKHSIEARPFEVHTKQIMGRSATRWGVIPGCWFASEEEAWQWIFDHGKQTMLPPFVKRLTVKIQSQ